MEEDERVLEVNDAFYRAFSSGDIGAMENLWTVDDVALTTHPWRPSLVGRELVINSWRAILASPPLIRCSQPVVTRLGGLAFVTCLEVAGEATLSVTNVFILEAGEWKICHHHAGPVAPVFDTKPGEDESIH